MKMIGLARFFSIDYGFILLGVPSEWFMLNEHQINSLWIFSLFGLLESS